MTEHDQKQIIINKDTSMKVSYKTKTISVERPYQYHFSYHCTYCLSRIDYLHMLHSITLYFLFFTILISKLHIRR